MSTEEIVETKYDVIVVGAGIGGIYAVYKLKEQGLSVLALEASSEVGGVWYHNRYPGARVDVESCEYCYYFSSSLFNEWRWSERYAAQPELLRYLNYVTDRFDIRRHIMFDTALERARWIPEEARYHVETEAGQRLVCRFLVMATGNLSAAREPNFVGLAEFKGEWVQASHWPDRPVELAGRRIGVVGTGSSGVQVITALAPQAGHLYVFQRTPNFSVPARNGPFDNEKYDEIAADVAKRRRYLLTTRAAITNGLPPLLPFADFSEPERLDRLERQWTLGGQGMNRVFADQGTDKAVNDFVADFVRNKIRRTVNDPDLAERLCPYDHPIGSRRLCLDTNYYETYNRDNVTLLDVSADPIERITEGGIQTRDAHYDLDVIVFALGFNAFRGAIDRVDILNEKGESPTERWNRGPRTLLGLMTVGFPNFFFLTGPGSPSVLSNMMIMNEEHVNWVADLIAYMDADMLDSVEPEREAEQEWTEQVAEAASKLLRLGVQNYMVHVNQDDGSRVFMPYVGGLDRYTAICRSVAAKKYQGFAFRRLETPNFPTVGQATGPSPTG